MDEIICDFLAETRENLDGVDQQLVELERTPDTLAVAAIFRALHTIKRTAGFFGFSSLGDLTHAGESLLAKMRDGELDATPAVVDALLRTMDAIRDMLGVVEATDGESDGGADHGELIALLTEVADGETAPSAAPASAPGPAAVAVTETAPSAADDDAPVPDQPVALDRPAGPAATAAPSGRGAADSALRVDVRVLERVMDLVGELALARNRLLGQASAIGDRGLIATARQFDGITSALQQQVTAARMQPIATAWSRFPRLVRDLAVTCGREVRLETSGAETELDRTLVEALRDPLTHLIRNAVDHGIEPPAERVANGKPPEGTVALRAFQDNGRVVVEVADDGGGIYPPSVRAKAVQKGLLSPDEADRLPESEILELIFRPGFSTAAAVTDVSGRGVGMDVVRTNVEAVGGTVSIASVVGAGTTFRIVLPLTLAIVPALIVEVGGDHYAVPQSDVVELVGLDRRAALSSVHDVLVHRVRDELLPVLDLAPTLGGVGVDPDDPADLVVVQAGGRRYALVVDAVARSCEIVVKPLGSLLQPVPAFAGTTILANGDVALILDVGGLASLTAIGTSSADSARTSSDGATDDTETLVLCRVAGDHRVGVPAGAIARLQEHARAQCQWADGRMAVRHGGATLPLVELADLLGLSSAPVDGEDPLSVLVVDTEGLSTGLVVDAILGVADDRPAERQGTTHPLLTGTAAVGDLLVEVVDVGAAMAVANAGRP